MSRTARRLVLLAVCAAGLAPVTAAEAQWSGASRRPPPLYPYELQPGQSYAVEVAPGTYVIHHPSSKRAYPGARRRAKHVARRHGATPKPRRTHANRALIEELRRRDAQRSAKLAAKKAGKKAARKAKKHKAAGRRPDQVINTKRIVHDKPLVIETRRVVQDPPKVIERRRYADDAPPRRGHTGSIGPKRAGTDDPRVIHADAEITILGPDRMSIRLVRKDGQSLDANARAPRVKK